MADVQAPSTRTQQATDRLSTSVILKSGRAMFRRVAKLGVRKAPMEGAEFVGAVPSAERLRLRFEALVYPLLQVGKRMTSTATIMIGLKALSVFTLESLDLDRGDAR